MKKDEFNAIFREHVRTHLSPKPEEREFVSKVYNSIQELLGKDSCLQIGSYPRFTAISPMHDLDVLYVLGQWYEGVSDPSAALSALQRHIKDDYKNPTKYRLEVRRQTHSITLQFLNGEREVFSVDIVPAYTFGQNSFGDDMYVVPEIATRSRPTRQRIYAEVEKGAHKMQWIKSEPRGYIKVAAQINQSNNDFRKSVKFVKAWRASCKKKQDGFALKAFHIEQILTEYFKTNPSIEIFDAVFNFFCELPGYVARAQIPDRADPSRNIDEYVDNLTAKERRLIRQARDWFLIKLESFSEDSNPADLLEGGFYERICQDEAYLFDQRIPILTEETLTICGKVLPRKGGFRETLLNAIGLIDVDRRIEFHVTGNPPAADLFKWKVKNDDTSEQPRGEITDHHTRNIPEHTQYNGQHYVECYAIRNRVCVGRARQNVVLRSIYNH